MPRFQFDNYRRIFQNQSFRNFWLGFALSAVGDAMTNVALTWYVWDTTQSPQALGLLAFFYTGPVVVGGLAAGWLLDRFDRRRVMQVDSLVRGVAVAAVPLLFATGRLELWHIYAVAAVYGSLMMISLAGGPALVPSLVGPEQLSTANALEMLAFTLSGVVGPFAAGLLVARVGGPYVLALDAVSYFVFAGALSQVRLEPEAEPAASTHATLAASARLADAFRLLLGNKVLLSTTLMYMAVNVGSGLMYVWLPVFASETLGGGPELFGTLVGLAALGQVASSVVAGSLKPSWPLGTMICVCEVLSGATLGLLLLAPNLPVAGLTFLLGGALAAPLTIWAQTLRMQIIPERLRGRTFALLRTLMQGANPLGGLLGGAGLPLLGLPAMIGASLVVMAVPGALGYLVRDLRLADGGM
jgi:MFS family permease